MISAPLDFGMPRRPDLYPNEPESTTGFDCVYACARKAYQRCTYHLSFLYIYVSINIFGPGPTWASWHRLPPSGFQAPPWPVQGLRAPISSFQVLISSFQVPISSFWTSAFSSQAPGIYKIWFLSHPNGDFTSLGIIFGAILALIFDEILAFVIISKSHPNAYI